MNTVGGFIVGLFVRKRDTDQKSKGLFEVITIILTR